MAFLKFSRDKRGVENFYLVEPSNRGKARPRLLYWFRTPPNVKVGRTPFDPDMRRAVEAQNPEIAFDWDAILRTPIPPPSDTERWRERRRVERAMRSADVEEEIDAVPGDVSVPAAPPSVEVAAAVELPSGSTDERAGRAVAGGEVAGDEDLTADGAHEIATVEPIGASNSLAGSSPGAPGQRRRRRRRRGRRPQAQGEV